MPNDQDADVTFSSGLAVDVTEDVHDRSDDVVSLDGSIESSLYLDSVDASGDLGVNPVLDSASHTSKEIPLAARNSKFFIEDELCRFQVSDTELVATVPLQLLMFISSGRRTILSSPFAHVPGAI
jgi:hypothetical protein